MLSDKLILSIWHLDADRWEVSIPLPYGLYGGGVVLTVCRFASKPSYDTYSISALFSE
ncbi:MAG: hypothetical protein IPN42_00135 [Methylococcaceae bacterium]|nr:hypothetical protein [Methylococcaceae bacterium]